MTLVDSVYIPTCNTQIRPISPTSPVYVRSVARKANMSIAGPVRSIAFVTLGLDCSFWSVSVMMRLRRRCWGDDAGVCCCVCCGGEMIVVGVVVVVVVGSSSWAGGGGGVPSSSS